MQRTVPLLLLAGTFSVFCTTGHAWQVALTTAPQGDEEHAAALRDQPIAEYQAELLELAYQSASALPLDPHVKNRSRAQEGVVAACLALGQPARALRYIEGIGNWRRGSGYADLAFYCAENDLHELVPEYLRRAEDVANLPETEIKQAWRRDRIRSKISRTLLVLGRAEEAARFGEGLEASEAASVEALRARSAAEESFDEILNSVDPIVARADFDQVRGVLLACAQLFDRFYGDEERRARVEDKIKGSWSSLPGQIRVELMMQLTDFALDHDDRKKALALVEETRPLLAESRLSAEYAVPLEARLATLRYRAGDREAAQRGADAAFARFEREREDIISIYRAAALLPLAEAYRAMDNPGSALAVYSRAMEEGCVNPNSRPRAMDLAALCCSMAVHEVEPERALRARIERMREGLGDPW